MPSGIIQVVLFDEHMNPVSERLIFNKTEDRPQLAFTTEQPYYQKRKKVISEIHLTDLYGNPVAGHVSITVTDDNDLSIDSLHTITTELLLSSELRGHIESPGYYLENHPDAEIALDHLMMTHGWRRYAIAEAIHGNYQLPETGYEVAKELSGTVKTLVSGKPVVNGEVMVITDAGNIERTATDASGRFRFYHHFPDSAKAMIKAANKNGKENVTLTMREETFPELKHIPVSLLSMVAEPPKESRSPDVESGFIKKAEQRARYDDDIRVVNLPEVMVSARRIEKKDEARLMNPFNAGSDKTIYRESFEKRAVTHTYQLLDNIAGVKVGNDGEIRIRGGGLAYVYIDGVPMDTAFGGFDSPLEAISVQDIDAIDIFKGSSAAIFGMRGANGVISITTRRGGNIDDPDKINVNFICLSPLGYQNPVEFYAPKYETTESTIAGIPDYRTTIFWKPDILVQDDGKATFDFYTSDFPATYSVVIEGLTNDGKIIRQVETLEVR
jgi:TonB-dependent SusC/RagA subfamily outer membrane receptor